MIGLNGCFVAAEQRGFVSGLIGRRGCLFPLRNVGLKYRNSYVSISGRMRGQAVKIACMEQGLVFFC